jgi:hypothetical protein
MANYDLTLGGKAWDHLDINQKAELLDALSDEALRKYMADPRCNQQVACETALAKRREPKALDIQSTPFNPRLDVSADARYLAGHIVEHLWIIFVVLPFVLAILYELLK